jgi:hypothetical protein
LNAYAVLRAKLQQANAGGSIRKRNFCMDCRIKSGNDEGKTKKRKSEAKRRQTQGSSAVASATAAPLPGEAHIYRRSTAVLVPLVSRFRSSSAFPARSYELRNRQGHEQI